MSHSIFFDRLLKAQDKNYFVHLVGMAMADDIITSDEFVLLQRIGKKMGFTIPEIYTLMNSPGWSDYDPPHELSKRFYQVYEIVTMAMTDRVFDTKEMRLASKFAVKSGFSENEIPALLVILIYGNNVGIDEEELFEIYYRRREFFSAHTDNKLT
jgi:hypothetical protein